MTSFVLQLWHLLVSSLAGMMKDTVVICWPACGSGPPPGPFRFGLFSRDFSVDLDPKSTHQPTSWSAD